MTAESVARQSGSTLTSSGLPFLPRALREARRLPVAILTGWATAFIPSIVLAMALAYFLPAAQQPQFTVDGTVAVLMLVVFAPVVETLIMGAVLLVLLRLFSPVVAVLVSAAGWGIAHSMVAAAWGLVIWWPFLIFSTLFVTWRRRSLAAAFAVPAVVHGLHNLPSALLLFSVSG